MAGMFFSFILIVAVANLVGGYVENLSNSNNRFKVTTDND